MIGMSAEFLAAWPLFGMSWLAAWLIAALLGVTGVLVVARGQAFVGLAVAQIATFGLALGLWAGAAGAHAHGATLVAIPVIAAVVAALVADRVATRGAHEAALATAWLYLVGSSGSVLVLSASPHGLDEVQRLLASSMVGAEGSDVLVFAGLLAMAALLIWTTRDRLLVLALDPAFAPAIGIDRRRWELLLAAWLGLVLGLTIRCAGVLYSVGCLVLPVLVVRSWCRESRWLFVASPLAAVTVAALGTIVAHHGDLPPAQVVVALLGLLAGAGWTIGRLRGR